MYTVVFIMYKTYFPNFNIFDFEIIIIIEIKAFSRALKHVNLYRWNPDY